eukprot:GILJ01002871.1.p1 GENE.GILJ01002871.1~~GILJ01002871.1.p1  ORF type:complete len:104 (+),score=6.78 GILJ01002871.1:299-610(+)
MKRETPTSAERKPFDHSLPLSLCSSPIEWRVLPQSTVSQKVMHFTFLSTLLRDQTLDFDSEAECESRWTNVTEPANATHETVPFSMRKASAVARIMRYHRTNA